VHDLIFHPSAGRGIHRQADLRPADELCRDARPPPGTGSDVDTVLRSWFTTVFSALVIRVAYGPGFAADPVDDATYTSQLVRMSSSYLLSGRQRAGR
jgi:hypothetical protein